MAGETRATMIRGAAQLLATKGLQGASFAEIIEHTGVPRGSIYHHFPGGKDQLIGEAIAWAGEWAIAQVRTLDGAPAEAVVAAFLGLWRQLLERGQFQAGCSVLAVTIATEAPPLLEGATTVFETWHDELTRLLTHGGLEESDASPFATLLIAASEGAVVMSRARQSFAPFDAVSEMLLAQVRERSAAAQPHPESAT